MTNDTTYHQNQIPHMECPMTSRKLDKKGASLDDDDSSAAHVPNAINVSDDSFSVDDDLSEEPKLDHWNVWKPEGAPKIWGGASGTAIDDHRFLVVGAGEDYKSCGYYDSNNQSWNPLPDLPSRLFGCSVVCVEETIYVVGGDTNDGSESDTLISLTLSNEASDDVGDIMAQEWKNLPPMREERSFFACVSHSRNIYVFGGFSWGFCLNSVEKYNIDTKKWTQLPDMPEERDGCGAGVVGNHIYVVGGQDGDLIKSNTTIVFDTLEEQWIHDIDGYTTIPPVPTMKRGIGSVLVAVADHFVIVVGKYSDTNVIQLLDTKLNIWTEIPSKIDFKSWTVTTIAGFLSGSRELIMIVRSGGKPLTLTRGFWGDENFGEIIDFDQDLLYGRKREFARQNSSEMFVTVLQGLNDEALL